MNKYRVTYLYDCIGFAFCKFDTFTSSKSLDDFSRDIVQTGFVRESDTWVTGSAIIEVKKEK